MIVNDNLIGLFLINLCAIQNDLMARDVIRAFAYNIISCYKWTIFFALFFSNGQKTDENHRASCFICEENLY